MTTYATTQDQFITIKGIKYAYRRFGASSGTPLFLHIHFRGTMDHWDPALIDPLAAKRPIILIDNSGVGRSEGHIQTTYAGWAQVVIDVLTGLGCQQVDVLGFSMGGCTAQMIALNAPKLVRKLILCGTIPSIGQGVVNERPEEPFRKLRTAKTKDEQLEAFLVSFFGPSKASQAAGKASFDRIHSSRPDRKDYLDVELGKMQSMAMQAFQDPDKAGQGSYNRLHELRIPVLVANGEFWTEAIYI